jgi:transcriptional regulator with XRE-family HTH domain
MAQGLRRRKNEDEVLVKFGTGIRGLREARGWMQNHLSDKSGLDQTYISLIERGIPNLTFRSVMKLAKAFNVPVSSIVVERQHQERLATNRLRARTTVRSAATRRRRRSGV